MNTIGSGRFLGLLFEDCPRPHLDEILPHDLWVAIIVENLSISFNFIHIFILGH